MIPPAQIGRVGGSHCMHLCHGNCFRSSTESIARITWGNSGARGGTPTTLSAAHDINIVRDVMGNFTCVELDMYLEMSIQRASMRQKGVIGQTRKSAIEVSGSCSSMRPCSYRTTAVNSQMIGWWSIVRPSRTRNSGTSLSFDANFCSLLGFVRALKSKPLKSDCTTLLPNQLIVSDEIMNVFANGEKVYIHTREVCS